MIGRDNEWESGGVVAMPDIGAGRTHFVQCTYHPRHISGAPAGDAFCWTGGVRIGEVITPG